MHKPLTRKRPQLIVLQFPVFFFLFKRHQPAAGVRSAPVWSEAGCRRHSAKETKMADIRKICPESLLCCVKCSRKPLFQGKLFILLCILIVDSGGATTHWVVTEDGKIQQQV